MIDYRMRLEAMGKTKRDRIIHNAKRMTQKFAIRNPAYKSVTIDGTDDNLIIISTQTVSTKTIEALPSRDFKIGSIVFWNGSHWLITKRDAESDITVRGEIEQCNRQIRWQNPSTKEIHERWCVVDKPYFSNLESNATSTESKREFKIQLPYDNESALLDVDKRFMLEIIGKTPRTYRLTSVDSMTERYDYNGEASGFLVINVEQDAYNPQTDNSELMICDYVTDNSTSAPAEREIFYTGTKEIKAGGPHKKFVATLNEVKDPTVTWSIDMDDNLKQYKELISVNTSGGELLIKTPNNTSLYYGVIRITATFTDGFIAKLDTSIVPLV